MFIVTIREFRVTKIAEDGIPQRKWSIINRTPVKDVKEGTDLITTLMTTDPELSVTLSKKRDDGNGD